MRYIFVVNGRQDKSHIVPDLQKQIEGTGIDYVIYETKGVGDGTRYVRLYCEFHEKEDICFVACGGSGTVNEVASGIIGFENKSMAILAYGTTTDFIKYYPDRDFTSLKKILEGEKVQIDAIKCNNDYAINVINIGFDGRVAYEANRNIEAGVQDGYKKGVRTAVLGSRFNKLDIYVDGEKISKWRTLLCSVANAKYCGGQFLCAPNAVVDDGLMEVCLIRSCSLLSFLRILPFYTEGKHLSDQFCLTRMVYRRARHVEVKSKDLVFVALDGEIIAATHFVMDILDKAVTLVLPHKD